MLKRYLQRAVTSLSTLRRLALYCLNRPSRHLWRAHRSVPRPPSSHRLHAPTFPRFRRCFTRLRIPRPTQYSYTYPRQPLQPLPNFALRLNKPFRRLSILKWKSSWRRSATFGAKSTSSGVAGERTEGRPGPILPRLPRRPAQSPAMPPSRCESLVPSLGPGPALLLKGPYKPCLYGGPRFHRRIAARLCSRSR